MDWRTVDFDWNRARAFLVTAEEGSFSAAARALGMAQPTVGRQVAALERELGVVVFERVGHGLTLTPTGLDLVDHVRAMGAAATRFSMAATGRSLSIEGTVCITASEVMAVYMLPPIIDRLRLDHPGVEVEIVASNSPSDLRRREADIAVRSFRPTHRDLVARKVGDSNAWLYAAPAYLDRLGNPTSPEGLSEATFIGFNRTDTYMDGLNALGLSLTRRNFRIITESQLTQWALTRRGAGIAIMIEEVGDADPLVRRALPGLPPFPVPTWLTAHREVRTSRRIRVVFDLLVEELSARIGRVMDTERVSMP